MNKSTKTAMILAAGLGTRLGPLTQNKPKALLEINGKSLLEINLRKLEAAGYERIIINTHHFHQQIEHFVRHFDSRMSIGLSHEADAPLETGGGLLKALPLLGKHQQVLVHNVDVITDLSPDMLLQEMLNKQAAAVLAVSERQSVRKLLFDPQFRLAGWKNLQTGEVKTVAGKQPVHELAFSAVSCIDTRILEHQPLRRVGLVELLLGLAQAHDIYAAFPKFTYWYDLGKIEQITEIEKALGALNSKT